MTRGKIGTVLVIVTIACVVFSIYQFRDFMHEVGLIGLHTEHKNKHLLATLPIRQVISYHDLVTSKMDETLISISRGQGKQIPKLLFRIAPFPLHKAPPEVREVLDSVTGNKDYLLVYFDDRDADLFMRNHFPRYLKTYYSLTVGSYRADILRLLILYHFGGIYNDIGHTYTRPLKDVFHPSDEFVSVLDRNTRSKCGYAIYNAFMAAYPRHPLIRRLLDYIANNADHEAYGDNDLDITGPIAMGKAFNLFFNRSESAIIPNGTYIDNGHRLRLLYQVASSGDQNHFIFNEHAQDVICTKFPDYHKVMFVQRRVVKYGFAWRRKIVYTCSFQSTATQHHDLLGYLYCLLRHQYVRFLYMYKYDYEH